MQALIVIVIGVFVFNAVGGGWIGYLLIGLLLLVGMILLNPGPFVFAFVKERHRNMPMEKKIEQLAKQYPDIDWAALSESREAAQKAVLAEQAEAAARVKNGTDEAVRNSQNK